jgi:hypothetical protein
MIIANLPTVQFFGLRVQTELPEGFAEKTIGELA